MSRYAVEEKGNVSILTFPAIKAFEQDFLLTADRHWDHSDSDQQLQMKHLEQARERDAKVFDFGDFFCAMQGRDDKRSSKGELRTEHKKNDYYDSLVDTAVDSFKSYADLFIRMSSGNHESSVLRKHETDITGRLVSGLNEHRRKGFIHRGGYSGWILFKYFNQVTKQADAKKLWYIHGYGGGGPVTKGVIQSNRQAVYTPDAHIVVNGHIHEQWVLQIPRIRLNDDGDISRDSQTHVRIPSYKDDYGDGFGGWEVERGGPPKPIGAIWMSLKQRKGEDLEVVFTEAK